MQPAVAQGFRRQFRFVPITLHDVHATGANLAHCAGRHLHIILIQHSDLNGRAGMADGIAPVFGCARLLQIARVQGGQERRGFSLAIAVDEIDAGHQL